jgi:hypothetical protein
MCLLSLLASSLLPQKPSEQDISPCFGHTHQNSDTILSLRLVYFD